MLWRVSTGSHHICRVYGVSAISGQACLVMKQYPHSLASELASMPGQLRRARSHWTIAQAHHSVVCLGWRTAMTAPVFLLKFD